MKRRFFLTAGAIASTGFLAKAETLGQLHHFTNFQMLNGSQQKQLKDFDKALLANMKSHNLSSKHIKACTRINRIVQNEVKGTDYNLAFFNEQNNMIELVAKNGKLSTIIH